MGGITSGNAGCYSIKQQIATGYLGREPLATNTAATQLRNTEHLVMDFMSYDKDNSGGIDEGEFTKRILSGSWPAKNETEAKNLFAALSEDGTISAERYGAFINVRTTGGDKNNAMFPYMSKDVNTFLEQIAQKGPNTLFDRNHLTLGQMIDKVQHGEIKYATTEQIDKGYLKAVKKEN